MTDWSSRAQLLRAVPAKFKFVAGYKQGNKIKDLFIILAAHPLDALVRARQVDERVSGIECIKWAHWLSKKDLRRLDLVTVGSDDELEALLINPPPK